MDLQKIQDLYRGSELETLIKNNPEASAGSAAGFASATILAKLLGLSTGRSLLAGLAGAPVGAAAGAGLQKLDRIGDEIHDFSFFNKQRKGR